MAEGRRWRCDLLAPPKCLTNRFKKKYAHYYPVTHYPPMPVNALYSDICVYGYLKFLLNYLLFSVTIN